MLTFLIVVGKSSGQNDEVAITINHDAKSYRVEQLLWLSRLL